MATRNILTDEDKGLSKKSRVVTDFNERLHVLLDDMNETLIEANGLGLAAPQVGVLRRVALIVETDTESEPPVEKIIELVNPELISFDGELTGSEGCLSVPGVYGMVTRPENVKVKAQDRFGKSFELECSGIAARAVCHEVNHLDGVLFTSMVERFLTEEELAEMAAKNREREEKDKQEEKQE